MAGWFAMSLGDGVMAWEPLGRIEERFRREYEKAGNPAGMALFSRHESEGRLHCEVVVYFSPAAAGVAREVGAVPCARPSPGGLGMVAGDDAARTALFPGFGLDDD